MDNIDTRAGLVAMVGLPNAGKSTLVNRMVGQKVSIVTPKAQTTRFRVRGVCMEDRTQIILTDTPGMFFDKNAFNKAMFKEAEAGLLDADAVAVIVDSTKPTHPYLARTMKTIFKSKPSSNTPPVYGGGKGGAIDTPSALDMPPLTSPPQAGGRGVGSKRKMPVALVLNKVDEADKQALLTLAAELNEAHEFDHTFMVSALRGDGVGDVKNWLADKMPESPYLYDPEELSDLPMRHMAAEVTREHCFKLLQQEIPYGVHVMTEHWEDKSEGLAVIKQLVIVPRESHKKLVIGKRGDMLKRIGIRARSDLEKMLEKKIHLDLHVKVDEKWQEKMVRVGLHPEQYQ